MAAIDRLLTSIYKGFHSPSIAVSVLPPRQKGLCMRLPRRWRSIAYRLHGGCRERSRVSVLCGLALSPTKTSWDGAFTTNNAFRVFQHQEIFTPRPINRGNGYKQFYLAPAQPSGLGIYDVLYCQ
jgi:hypothetical protein